MLKLLLLFLLHVSQPKHFLVETESKAKTPGGSLTELGGQDASSSITGRSGGFSGGTRPSKRLGVVDMYVSSPVHLGYEMTITCAASHALGRCAFHAPSQPVTRTFHKPRQRTFEYKFEDLDHDYIAKEEDRISISDRAYKDPKICEIVVENIQSYDIGEWRCEVLCSKEERRAGQCKRAMIRKRCRSSLCRKWERARSWARATKNIVVTETPGPYEFRAPGELVRSVSWPVELGRPITISCNANKELATCMFKPPYSDQWNETYVRSGDEVYIKENSRIGDEYFSGGKEAARGPCQIYVDPIEKEDLGAWRCLVREKGTTPKEIEQTINVAVTPEYDYGDEDEEHND